MTNRIRLDDMTDDQLEALYADLERARDVAVALENETARLEAEQEALLKATADLIHGIGYARHALARDVLGWVGAREDMDLRQTVSYAVAEHRSEQARAEHVEQQLARVRRIPRLPHHSQQDGELGRAFTRGWQSVVTAVDEALAGHPVDPEATAYPEGTALDGNRQRETARLRDSHETSHETSGDSHDARQADPATEGSAR